MSESSVAPQTTLDGKAVLVTGGTTGIGRATARLLATQGARVLIFGRHERELHDALEEIRATGADVFGLTANQARTDEVQRVFAEVDRRFERLDVLVNNAAVAPGDLASESADALRYAVDANLFGYIACAQEGVARMKRAGAGHIVNVGSMSADLREEENSVYVATKAAIQAFSDSLRKTVNRDGIKVTLIEPGRVATDLTGLSLEEKRAKETESEILRPEDIARCVLYCLTQPPRCDVVSVQLRPHLQVI